MIFMEKIGKIAFFFFKLTIRVVENWVKFHILIYLGPLHKYPIKEGFLTSWGVKSNKKPCRQNHRFTMGTFQSRIRDSRTFRVGRSVGWQVGNISKIASGFRIIAPAQPSATVLSCIRPCFSPIRQFLFRQNY